MKRHFLLAYDILREVFVNGKYADDALTTVRLTPMAVKLAYGVLEQNVKLEYILGNIFSKAPKKEVYIFLKLGAYALLTLTDVPPYAIVSECVEAVKARRREAAGFVNACLKRVAAHDYAMPSEEDERYLSVVCSKPKWFADKLVAEYGREMAIHIMSQPAYELEHIRPNLRVLTLGQLEGRLASFGERYEVSEVGGLLVRLTDNVKKLFADGLATYQSPSSMLAARALDPKDGEDVLDLCSAPGGKAVYIGELAMGSHITACDLYTHRVRLVTNYANRMKATGINAVVWDARTRRLEWENAFDKVLVDAPCSCLGTFRKHPDVFLTRREEDISALAEQQRRILLNAASYVKKGGALVYSTCTLFDEENKNVVDALLDKGGFALEHMDGLDGVLGGMYADNDGSVTILPEREYDGFYIARLKKL